jgi:hypothetical protein
LSSHTIVQHFAIVAATLLLQTFSVVIIENATATINCSFLVHLLPFLLSFFIEQVIIIKVAITAVMKIMAIIAVIIIFSTTTTSRSSIVL